MLGFSKSVFFYPAAIQQKREANKRQKNLHLNPDKKVEPKDYRYFRVYRAGIHLKQDHE